MLKQLQLHLTKILLTTAFLLMGVMSWGQATENFSNIPTTNTGSYQSRSWTGTNGVTWTATNARTDQTINGKAIATNNSGTVTSPTYSGGMGTLTFNYVRAFTGTSSRSLEVWVNGTKIGSTITVSSTSNTVQQYSNTINVSGNVILEIKTFGAQIKIDDISWTAGAPTVTTGTATNISTTGAQLNGTINANGTSTTPSFQYGLTTSYGTNTTATPSPVTGSSATGIIRTITGLSVNTRYYFRAVGTQSTATNGANASFWTLAAVPNAPIASNVSVTTADLALSADSNPATTQYIIYDLYSELYVQTDGTLGATAVWRTAAQWGTVNLTGLTPETDYAFYVKARNGANVETALSPDGAEITTLSNTAPILSADPLNAFGAVCINTTTTENSFGLYGENLTGADVVVGPLAGYTFSATAGGTYTSTVSFTPVGGEVLADVFVRFTPTDATSYNGDIEISGGGAASVFVAASGSGINTAASITTAAVSVFTEFTATMGGTVTNEGCSPVTATGVVYATTTTPVIGGDGVTQLATALPETTPFTVDASGLMPSTQYYVRAYAVNNGGTVYGNQVTFTTSAYVLNAPVATEETSATTSSFFANWNAVAGATGYRLDVSTSHDFETITPGGTTIEGFANVTGTAGTYLDRTWTGDDGVTTWSAYKVRTDQDLGSGTTITFQNASGSYLVSSTISGGITNIQFDVQQVFSGTGGQLTIKVLTGAGFTTESFVDTMSYSTTQGSYDSGVISGITGDYKIRIDNNTSARPIIDNLAYTSSAITVSLYVDGYENLSVGNVTSYEVTGLEAGTTYYYRVRAENTDYNVTSANSNVITAATGVINVWNGTEWSAGYVPTEIDEAIITGLYNTAYEGTFTAATLTVNTGGSMVIASGDNITIVGEVVNNAEASAFVIENNANLIQESNVINTGEIQVQKNSSPLYRLDYTLWSSPVLNQNLLAFSPQTLTNRFYDYDESTDLFTTIAPGTNNFQPGYGYLIRMSNTHPAFVEESTPGTAWTGVFEGQPINGPVTVTMENALNGYNLVGNPYPSPINVADFYAANIGTIVPGSALYFWRKRNDPNASTYCVMTKGAYTANSAAGGDTGTWFNETDSNNWVINSGQGFFVQATGGTLEFNNEMRAEEVNNNQFFRTTEEAQQQSSRLWLNLTTEGKFSQTAIVYNPNMTLGIDYGWDGKALIGSDPLTVYTMAQDETLSIQARPEFDLEDQVTLGIYVETPGNYTIGLDHVDGLFTEGQEIYIIDNLLNITHNLTEGSYSFTTETGTFNDRFKVIYTIEGVLDTDNPVLASNEVVVFQTNGDININAGTHDITAVTVYDMRGRALYTNNDVNASQMVINNLESAQQVLIVNITTNKGTVSKKVVY
ncbi:T9SS sorting signal type C domain-containing protein [Flavobacterium salilacus subsp. salilacus]|uniref:T9SS sorting signal type C domain-containing protein n=1 Tax=Flavobacterium TaxID=237 RepID=UPI001074CB76|nr:MULTISPECIES: T9SS sorting signal type C domain-containing protein [Flavobacterium]KAF2519472.1 T9SS sorting signal type C domain-containing protein [Flavobacterium salilacus subsp. salilacus]MBE1614631.1 T9SS sorting signal type C domain-containing protein [Flavobacterium sp. SaA2.13]